MSLASKFSLDVSLRTCFRLHSSLAYSDFRVVLGLFYTSLISEMLNIITLLVHAHSPISEYCFRDRSKLLLCFLRSYFFFSQVLSVYQVQHQVCHKKSLLMQSCFLPAKIFLRQTHLNTECLLFKAKHLMVMYDTFCLSQEYLSHSSF